ncbi:hypothetical protein L207DRAFT_629947 [Hyaloscypha variabilis F]|uniref:Ubiquitin-like domain-containing protein n=1 Tax=Hyaloscypha variabilis (strain UAMH 11265 / GT02V1 / F) TaxID=1149755 RepID=A0A2J6S3Z9_HYAVF|nr:hypothetical protein L207DRAFT_629947 [Hyaloscypha variabilis F]
MKIKRENDEITDSDIIDVTHTAPKRQRKEDNASKTAPMTSDIRGTSVPDDLLQAYRHLLPKSREGIAFLFSSTFSDALQAPAERAATLHEVTREQAIEELRRLLAIKVFTVDEDATKISPTPLMDEMWHAAILDTKLYAMVQSAFGLHLHHRPSGACDQESELRKKRLVATKAMYSAFFSTNPLERAPPPPSCPQIIELLPEIFTIFVQTTQKIHEVRVTEHVTFLKILQVVEDMEGIPRSQLSISIDGNPIVKQHYRQTLGGYGIWNEDTLHIYPEEIGS